ncbi:MBL fold metallo-hydrolase [Peptococcus simiae]|uniref:MBL fold metallo-hydrolase n=1 Tax=Peptococcus simiae TaxID=1643805 RepID=A0ABW9H2K1_9FIRM
MEIDILGSSSSGNAVRISDGSTSLLLDAGLPIKKIKEGLHFRTSALDGVLVTHEHQDHAKAVGDLIKMGVPVYASAGTFEALEKAQGNCIKALQPFAVGTFTVLPFAVIHDALEPLGFVIRSSVSGEKLLYVTDTMFIPYNFTNLTHIMIECNYQPDILWNNVRTGQVLKKVANRVVDTHMSLKTTLAFLQENVSLSLREVWLLHLSDQNSDENLMKEAVQKAIGIPVYVAKK